jgi:hypothetical protein
MGGEDEVKSVSAVGLSVGSNGRESLCVVYSQLRPIEVARLRFFGEVCRFNASRRIASYPSFPRHKRLFSFPLSFTVFCAFHPGAVLAISLELRTIYL